MKGVGQGQGQGRQAGTGSLPSCLPVGVGHHGASLRATLTLCALVSPIASSADTRPDTFLARVSALASMQTLNAELLAGRSATRVLEGWCARHRMAEDTQGSTPRLRAERVDGPDKPIEAAQRQRLAIGPDERVGYRHVRLTCGTRVLSEADNWYVPARLTPAMNKLLEATDTSFGTVVAPLGVMRETFEVRIIWQPLPPDWDMTPPPLDHPAQPLAVPPFLFEHRAVLFDASHKPFSLVNEHYARDVLDFGTGR